MRLSICFLKRINTYNLEASVFKDIVGYLEECGIEYKLHADLSCISTMRVGGTALVFASPDSAEKLCRFIAFLTDIKVKFKVTGRMSNILPRDTEFQGVIINTLKLRKYYVAENMLAVECGAYIPSLSSALAKRGISLLPEISSIPATVGGAVYSNAGAHGAEISTVFVDGDFYDMASGRIVTLSANQMNFSYRTSRLKAEPLLLLEARLNVKNEKAEDIKRKITEYRAIRREHQPIEYPSLGSIILRKNGVSAGEIIDKCGLKGTSVGGATVSSKHAGFIINSGGATANDVLELISLIRRTVLECVGVELLLEIEIL